jgi:putative tryptophan/tyrosine transport system substrate-binding protein
VTAFTGRREFITLVGRAVAAWPLAAHAQQQGMSVIGLLRSTPSAPFAHFDTAVRQGLNEVGFVEGQNVTIEYRHADNQHDRLPALAGDLVRRQVAVIVCNGDAAEGARAATASIPIVFVTAEDPVRQGLVTNLGRPGGNLTGVTFFGGGQLGAKRAELLFDLVPKATVLAVLMDPRYGAAEVDLREAEVAARAHGRQMVVVKAAGERGLEFAFAKFAQAGAGALLVAGGSIFASQRQAIVALAARNALPAIYGNRDYVAAGGLISYSASVAGAYRQAGIYAGRILKGAKPAELPVLQPTTFELVFNLKTAKALGLEVPPTLLARADEVIE